MKRLSCLVAFLIATCSGVVAQPLTAYFDNQNQFFVWDDGMIRKADYLVPIEYKVGRYAVPFLDNARNFKIYSKGATVKINNGFTSQFFATDYLVAFQNAQILNVWEDGEIIKLSNLSQEFYVGDSLVMYFDKVRSTFNLYYNKEIYPLESFLSGISSSKLFGEQTQRSLLDNQDIASGQIPAVRVSDNVAAYVNFANQFKIFYRGDVIEQEAYLVKSFDAGRNIVPYVNANHEFIVFYKGETQMVEQYQPYAYKAGDDLVAYIGNDNYFKIFYNDSVYNIGYFQPDFHVVDNIVYYEDMSGYFYVFYKGQTYNLESYVPENITAHYNSLAYVTRGRMLKVFTEGQVFDVVTADVPYWKLNYDVIHYRFGTNLNKVFYKGKTY